MEVWFLNLSNIVESVIA